ncbi:MULTISPECIES: hypothetical protein [Roseomonadaceae]|uniref:Big-1 domain-containing protein n=1 Tax=Falsiroseomonas oleicola TaxID=2801474 RepID=A0ABS6HDA9_9PROT|nr:hypothetical protein [Roseomonas oleicola]MBU8545802.1 hypothetical protein [Roseomonas oleicola]
MPPTDVRVTLRVASSDHLRPRAVEGTAISIEATILDQEGAPVTGAIADLSWVTPQGVEMRAPGRISDARGIATALLAVAGTGAFVARCAVVSPIARVALRPFTMIDGGVQLGAVPATPVVTPQGAFLILPNGRAIGGASA